MTIDNHILCMLFRCVLQIGIMCIEVYEKILKNENAYIRIEIIYYNEHRKVWTVDTKDVEKIEC